MNLAEMLSYADIHELSQIAKNYECQCSVHSKNDLIQSILSTINRREVLEQQIFGLAMEDIRFINSLVFDKRDSFSLEDLLARVKQTKFLKTDEEWNPRQMITAFKTRGWLFNGFSQQTKSLFQVPQDLKSRFSDALAKQFQTQLQGSLEPPAVYRDEQYLLIDDIQKFLQLLSQQEMQLSADGYIYKRGIQLIMEKFAVAEEPVGKSAWRFGYGRKFKEYPSRFSFIYDYCFFHDLIEEQQQQLRLTKLGAKSVSERHKEDMLQVYRFWLRLYKGPIPNIQSIVQWLDRLGKSWVTIDSLGAVLCKLIKPYYYDSAESIFEQRMIQMMMHLGLLRIGEDHQLGMMVQISKLGSSVIQGIYVAEDDKIDLKIDMP